MSNNELYVAVILGLTSFVAVIVACIQGNVPAALFWFFINYRLQEYVGR